MSVNSYEFESPVDLNSSQTIKKAIVVIGMFESPVDLNSSQTCLRRDHEQIKFESPVDLNSSQTQRSRYGFRHGV